MTDQKQDTLNEVLKDRVCDLEAQLKRTKEEMAAQHDEAVNVVRQWEEAFNTVQKKLEEREALLEEETQKCQRAMQSLTKTEEIVTYYSSSLKELQTKSEESAKHTAELLDKEQASAAQVLELSHVNECLKKELQSALEQNRNATGEIEKLRDYLEKATAENECLRGSGQEIASKADKLLDRIDELKRENSQLRRHVEEHEEQNLKSQNKIEELESELEQQKESTKKLAAELDVARNELAENIAQHNEAMDLFLEEQRKESMSRVTEIQQLTTQNEELAAQLQFYVKNLEEMTAEAEAARERHSGALAEAEELRGREKQLTEQLRKLEADTAEINRISEEKYSTVLSSLAELSTAVQTLHAQDLLSQEENARAAIAVKEAEGVLMIVDTIRHAAVVEAVKNLRDVQHLTSQNTILTSEQNQMHAEVATLRETNHNDQLAINDLRKSVSRLETELGAALRDKKDTEQTLEDLRQGYMVLENQASAMRQELSEVDEFLNSNLNEMREENEKFQADNSALRATIRDLEQKCTDAEDAIEKLKEELQNTEQELHAQSKTLSLVEDDARAKDAEIEKLGHTIDYAEQQLAASRKENNELKSAVEKHMNDSTSLKLKIQSLEMRIKVSQSEHSVEIEKLRAHLSAHVDALERQHSLVEAETQRSQDLLSKINDFKENELKMRSAMKELKERCESDSSTIRSLLNTREELTRDRDIIVEKYNRLHDAFRNFRKESSEKAYDELRRLIDLCSQQEDELQKLRQQNLMLRKSVGMFVASTRLKSETVFAERLNVNEGPLRHPKKRRFDNNQ